MGLGVCPDEVCTQVTRFFGPQLPQTLPFRMQKQGVLTMEAGVATWEDQLLSKSLGLFNGFSEGLSFLMFGPHLGGGWRSRNLSGH